MLTKEQEREQYAQEIKATIQKIKTTIPELCSKIGEIDRGMLEFIIGDANNVPSKSDIVDAYPTILNNPELAHNVVALHDIIFDHTSEIIPQNMQGDKTGGYVLSMFIIPEALSEVRASLFDTAPASEVSTSTLDTAMETNSSVLHGSSDYCEL